MAEKLQKHVIYKNIATLQKARQFASRFIYKKPDTLRYAISHEMLKLTFTYKKYDTLRYVMFYEKRQTLCKKQDNLSYVFILRKSGHFALRKFIDFFKVAKGREAFLYAKNNALCVTFL